MKKRILSVLLTSALVLSLTACGGSTPSEAQPQTSDTNNGTSAVTSESTTSAADTESSAPEATTSATSETTTATTAPAEPEVPVELPVLNVEPALIMNGCMAFKCDGKNYVYNITENEMYETEYDVSDIEVMKGCIAVFGDVSEDGLADTNAYVVNLKTGEQYADVKPFYDSDWNGSYLTVGTLEESFSGNTISVGMLNDKGEWVLPLSDAYAVCTEDNIDKTEFIQQNSEIIFFQASNGDINFDFIYSIAKNSIIDFSDKEISDVWCITDDNIVLSKSEWSNSDNVMYCTLYYYDLSTEEITQCSDAFNGLNWSRSTLSNCAIFPINNIYNVYDLNYNLMAKYDLSDYNLTNNSTKDAIKGATENVIVFTADNDKRDTYTIALNKDGSNVFEPIKGKIGNARFSENKIIFITNNTDRIVDINTGEITEYDDSFDIIAYDDINDLMLVKTNGAYYLVDPEAPETLINPFERASN